MAVFAGARLPSWVKDPRVGFIGCYTAVAAIQLLALVDPSTTAYDRGFGVPALATFVSWAFFAGALGSLAGQFWPKVPWEYMSLPILSAGYATFGIAAMAAAAFGEGRGYLIYGLGYFGFGALFHARWRVQAAKFEKMQQDQADAEVARIRAQHHRRADTSVESPEHDERG